MAATTDNYEIYYADKLWNSLPAIYRTLDTDTYDSNGPLREMVNRIGVQAAIVRRSMDRMWEDQSIESCDDWVISYIADLLATNLVASLDARGQRQDVAKTIYYRRRKGTVAILEEIAADITGWNARVVEFFRRLGRTRHNLDPKIGMQSVTDKDIHTLQLAEGLVGTWTNTGIGGWADLRNNYGASKTNSAFDEYYHMADFRRGQGHVGWYNIPRLGVFLWRLYSFPVGWTTPVQSKSCPDHYTFDPTGREIPLFAVSDNTRYGDNWVSPAEWHLPTPISQQLLQLDLPLPIASQNQQLAPQNQYHLYAMSEQQADGSDKVFNQSLGIFDDQHNLIAGDLVTADPALAVTTSPDPHPTLQFFIDPVHGELIQRGSGPTQFLTTYTYGFSSQIGAGPYDRRVIGEQPVDQPSPINPVQGGGDVFSRALGTLGATGTIVIGDSLTYPHVKDLLNITNVTLATDNVTRPLIRSTATEWQFHGADEARSTLQLDGLFVSGGDIVLTGGFKSVTITCCTFDPGDAADVVTDPQNNPATIYGLSADGRDLIPSRLWVEANIQQLTIKRSILGPIRTRANGTVETLSLQDSIVQAIPTGEASPAEPADEDSALALNTGEVDLSRCTLLGPAYVHRLSASECILDDVVLVDDAQHGCVRFSAWATDSILPRQYESVQIAPQSPLFTTVRFGQPGYAQLLSSVDSAILAGATGATISAGAQDGSEMGVFAREKNPIKERSLLIKYQEFMPLGLTPVIIYVT